MNRRVQNPNGIEAFSPGLARFREGLPWEAAITSHNPEGVEYQMLTKRIQPFQGFDFSLFSTQGSALRATLG